MVIMYMQYIYHIAIRRERRVGTKNREVTGTPEPAADDGWGLR